MSSNKFHKLGAIAAFIHVLIFVCFFIYINVLASGKAQIHILWIYWIIIDFPVSLLHIPTIISGDSNTLTIFFHHGVLGTLWWYFIPNIARRLRDYLKSFFSRVKK